MRQTPFAEINRQFDAFVVDTQSAMAAYFDALATDAAVASDTAIQVQSDFIQRTFAMSQSLVTYFNRLPIALPKTPGPYRTSRPRTAIQTFIANRLTGQDPSSLVQTLQAIPLPGSAGPPLALYSASLATAIAKSRQEILEGVRLLFSGQDVLGLGTKTPTIPAR